MMWFLIACAGGSSTGTTDDTAPPFTVPDDSGRPGDGPANHDAETVPGLGIVFDPPGGLYDDALTVSLSGNGPVDEIRFSTDGRDPLGPTGQAWTGDRAVTQTAVFRAIATHGGEPVGEERSASFIFPAQAADQQPWEGAPTTWYGGYPADYQMDPDVLDDPRHELSLDASLRALPTLSLIFDPDDLFGTSGIYDNPENEGAEWERPVSVQWLYPDDPSQDIAVNAGVRMFGGASRSPGNAPKKSMRLVFRSQYGPGRLAHDPFGEAGPDTFDTLILRARYNHSWVHWDHTQRSRAQYLRDEYARDTHTAMGGTASRGTWRHLYINGLYWGMYNAVERPSGSAMADWFGGGEDEWDVINSGEAIDGDATAWNALVASANGGDTAAVGAAIDQDALIDYMLLNFWLGNDDWPHHNWYAARHAADDGPWRFFSWDAEHTLKDPVTNVTGADADGSPGRLHRAMLSDATYVQRFRERAQTHLADDGPLGPAAAVARFDALQDEVYDGLLAESARWGDHRRDDHSYAYGPYELYTVHDHYVVEDARLRSDWLPARTGMVIAQLKQAGLHP